MKKLFVLLFISIALFSCSASKKSTSTSGYSSSTNAPVQTVSGDGSSYEKAIIIEEKSETKGVNAEYAWLREHYPGYSMIMQSLNYKDKDVFDILKIKTKDGEEKSVYFNITNFYGKF